ncbi:sodium:proton antiporter [Campylobacterota bacterium]|nr:sodium:proton antiporter [Campylobacterota bacterium]
MDNLLIISSLTVLIMVSPFFSRLSGVSVAVVEIVLGSIAAFFGFLDSNDTLFNSIAKVGFLYLMFLAGLEVNLRDFATLKKPLWQRIALFFMVMYSLAMGLYITFELSPIYIIALPIVSVGMIITLIHEQSDRSEWLSFALTLGIVGELLSIFALTILSGFAQLGGFGFQFVETMLMLCLVLVIAWLFFRVTSVLMWWFPHLKKLIMPDVGAMDEDVRVSIALFFVLTSTMLYFGLELVLGAFMAGMFISNFFEHKTDLAAKLGSFGFGFLVPFFFIFVGSTLDLTLLTDLAVLRGALLIVLAMIALRIVASFVAFRKLFSPKERLLVALGESMPLTFLVAVATIGLRSELLSTHEYSSFILASMLEAVLVMVFIKLILGKKRTNHQKSL